MSDQPTIGEAANALMAIPEYLSRPLFLPEFDEFVVRIEWRRDDRVNGQLMIFIQHEKTYVALHCLHSIEAFVEWAKGHIAAKIKFYGADKWEHYQNSLYQQMLNCVAKMHLIISGKDLEAKRKALELTATATNVKV